MKSHDDTWIQTFTGRKFSPFSADPQPVHIRDIAHALANLCRFTGHTRRFYSVAQHCVHVAKVVPFGSQPHALLHDAAEAYFGDLASPIKHDRRLETYREAEKQLKGRIYRQFGLATVAPAPVAIADIRMLLTEREQLLTAGIEPKMEWAAARDSVGPYDFSLPCWSPVEAEQMFLAAFVALFSTCYDRGWL